jgi:hypothetical protein
VRAGAAVDLGGDPRPIEDIVEEFRVGRAALAKLNPALRGTEVATGIVVIQEDGKPCQSSDYDGLHGNH